MYIKVSDASLLLSEFLITRPGGPHHTSCKSSPLVIPFISSFLAALYILWLHYQQSTRKVWSFIQFRCPWRCTTSGRCHKGEGWISCWQSSGKKLVSEKQAHISCFSLGGMPFWSPNAVFVHNISFRFSIPKRIMESTQLHDFLCCILSVDIEWLSMEFCNLWIISYSGVQY